MRGGNIRIPQILSEESIELILRLSKKYDATEARASFGNHHHTPTHFGQGFPFYAQSQFVPHPTYVPPYYFTSFSSPHVYPHLPTGLQSPHVEPQRPFIYPRHEYKMRQDDRPYSSSRSHPPPVHVRFQKDAINLASDSAEATEEYLAEETLHSTIWSPRNRAEDVSIPHRGRIRTVTTSFSFVGPRNPYRNSQDSIRSSNLRPQGADMLCMT